MGSRFDDPWAHRQEPWYARSVVSAAAKKIIEAALKIEPIERERIAHELLESIDGSADAGELSPVWEAEIQRRLRKIESGEASFVSAEGVFAGAETILRRER